MCLTNGNRKRPTSTSNQSSTKCSQLDSMAAKLRLKQFWQNCFNASGILTFTSNNIYSISSLKMMFVCRNLTISNLLPGLSNQTKESAHSPTRCWKQCSEIRMWTGCSLYMAAAFGKDLEVASENQLFQWFIIHHGVSLAPTFNRSGLLVGQAFLAILANALSDTVYANNNSTLFQCVHHTTDYFKDLANSNTTLVGLFGLWPTRYHKIEHEYSIRTLQLQLSPGTALHRSRPQGGSFT